MPVKTVIHWAHKVVCTTCTGTLTMAEVAETCIQLARDPAFDPAFSHLNDLTGVSEVHLSAAEMKDFVARKLDPFSETSKRVFVASEPFVFGMTRMYESLINASNLVVVRSLKEGRECLGLEPDAMARPASRA
jgi:hypothetical protein